jgi:hypothetical protein
MAGKDGDALDFMLFFSSSRRTHNLTVVLGKVDTEQYSCRPLKKKVKR